MGSHGTALQVTPSIQREFHSSVIAQLPNLTDEEMQRYNRNKGDLGTKLRVALVPSQNTEPPAASAAPVPVSTLPEIGIEFELTLDFDRTDPLGMVRSDGYDPKDWEHKGNKPKGVQTRRFKLVSVGYRPNLDAVWTAITQHGDVPEGQWREALKVAYPTPDGKGPIGFDDPSWVSPDGYRRFPYLFVDGMQWNSDFSWTDFEYDGLWRWLVACQ